MPRPRRHEADPVSRWNRAGGREPEGSGGTKVDGACDSTRDWQRKPRHPAFTHARHDRMTEVGEIRTGGGRGDGQRGGCVRQCAHRQSFMGAGRHDLPVEPQSSYGRDVAAGGFGRERSGPAPHWAGAISRHRSAPVGRSITDGWRRLTRCLIGTPALRRKQGSPRAAAKPPWRAGRKRPLTKRPQVRGVRGLLVRPSRRSPLV